MSAQAHGDSSYASSAGQTARPSPIMPRGRRATTTTQVEEEPVELPEEEPVVPPVPTQGGGDSGGGDDGDDGGSDDSSNGTPQGDTNNVPFALVPARAHADNIINYATSAGQRLFAAATKNLYSESSEMFDCDPDGLMDFIQLVEDRSNLLGYHGIFQIPDDINAGHPDTKDFLSNYGVITLEQVIAHAQTYVHLPTRDAQDSTQLYHCLMASLSSSGRAKISIWNTQYTVNGYPAGVPLLKVILREADVDTQATAAYIRQQLASLDDYMRQVDSDIKKFNIHVKSLLRDLLRRRQTSDDTMIHLFEGYKAASDKTFVEYILRREEEYEDGQLITPDQLMTLAANKYKMRTRKGTWNAPSESETKILALDAKLASLEKKSKKAKKTQDSSNQRKGQTNPSSMRDKAYKKPAWMTTPPTAAQKGKSIHRDGKEYWWCKYHNAWTRHKSAECRLSEKAAKEGNKSEGSKDKKKIKFAKALTAIRDDSEEDE